MPDRDTNLPYPGSLPDGYQEVLYWTIKDNPRRMILLQILALPLLFLSVAVFCGVAASLGSLPSSLEFRPGGVIGVILSVVVTIVLHELAHGIAMQRFGAQPRYGALWKQAMFYATAPRYAFRRNEYVQIALAPLILLSVLCILGMWFLSGTFWVIILTIAGIINATGAIGDLWVTGIVLRYPDTAYIVDEKDGVRVFLRQP
jgi:hypothetical protein